QEYRRDLVYGLDLLEAFLDGGLAFVSFQHLSGGELGVVAQQWIHTIAFLIVRDGGSLHGPLQIVAATRDAPIGGVRSRASASGLLEGVFLAHCALDLQ